MRKKSIGAGKADVPKSGFTIREWCVGAKVSNSTYYAMPTADKPKQFRVGAKAIITESPADWQARMTKRGKDITLVPYPRKPKPPPPDSISHPAPDTTSPAA